MSENRRIERLNREHKVETFDCGQAELNEWMRRYALQNASSGSAQTYVGLVEDVVIGYYSLTVGHVEFGEAPERLRKGLARHPVPVMLLARLAVDKEWQGRGIGKALLKDAIRRTMQVAEIAGVRALVVHAKDDEARSFYERFDFAASLSDPLHLFALTKDLRRFIE